MHTIVPCFVHLTAYLGIFPCDTCPLAHTCSVLIHNLNLMDCFLWASLNMFPYTCIFYELSLSVFLSPGFLHWQTNSLPTRHQGSPFHIPVFSVNWHWMYSWIQFPNSNVRVLIPLFSSQEIFVPRNINIIMYLSYTFPNINTQLYCFFCCCYDFCFVCFGCFSACLVLVPWIEPGLWQWKPWVLTIRLPRNFPSVTVNNKTSQCKVWFLCISFCP